MNLKTDLRIDAIVNIFQTFSDFFLSHTHTHTQTPTHTHTHSNSRCIESLSIRMNQNESRPLQELIGSGGTSETFY